MEELTIGQLARMFGLRPSALRFYERRGLVPAPGRRGGQRVYSPEVVPRIRFVRLAQEAGFTLREIHGILHEHGASAMPRDRWSERARGKLREMDRVIARAERRKALLERLLRCECGSLAECGGSDAWEGCERRG